MSETQCLNLCEIFTGLYKEKELESIIINILDVEGIRPCERIYIGSYFCSQFFLNLNINHLKELISICNKNDIKLTLVIPTFSQKDLLKGKIKISKLESYIGNEIDEITVNDYGMLSYIQLSYSAHINLGRLFMKDYRDPRHGVYFHQSYKPKIMNESFLRLLDIYNIKGIEFDLTHEELVVKDYPANLIIGYHSPYSYMTVGTICELASINKEESQKFRPNNTCSLECMTHSIQYFFEDARKWYRIGRTIYFKNTDCIITSSYRLRKIFSPYENQFLMNY